MRHGQDESKQSLLEAAARESPPAGREEQIWRALVARLDQPLPESARAAERALESATRVRPALSLVKLVAGVVAVSGAALGVWLAMHAPEPPGRHAALSTGASEQAARVSSAVAAEPSAPASPGAPSASAPASPGAPAASTLPSRARGRTSTLDAETELVAAAQRALQEHTPATTLALVRQHALEFPHGLLTQEREALHVLALCGLARTSEAGAARRAFLRTWPTSPLANRVRAACAPAKE